MNETHSSVTSTPKGKSSRSVRRGLRAVISRKRTWIFAMLAIVAALTLGRLAQAGFFSYQRLLEHEQSVRQFIEYRPLASFCIGFAVYTIVSCFPGLTGKSILFGWLFGLWSGLVIVSLSLTIAATFGLLVSRFLFQEFVRHKLAFVVRRIDQTFERQGPAYLVILRLLHVPFTPLNYAMGATEVSVRTFAWTTLVGMLPGNFAFVLAGSQLPTLQSVLKAGVWSLVDLRVLAALSAAVLIPVAARQTALLFRRPKSHQSESPQSESHQASANEAQRGNHHKRGGTGVSSSPGNEHSIKKVAHR